MWLFLNRMLYELQLPGLTWLTAIVLYYVYLRQSSICYKLFRHGWFYSMNLMENLSSTLQDNKSKLQSWAYRSMNFLDHLFVFYAQIIICAQVCVMKTTFHIVWSNRSLLIFLPKPEHDNTKAWPWHKLPNVSNSFCIIFIDLILKKTNTPY